MDLFRELAEKVEAGSLTDVKALVEKDVAENV